jgi:hypothetical protein
MAEVRWNGDETPEVEDTGRACRKLAGVNFDGVDDWRETLEREGKLKPGVHGVRDLVLGDEEWTTRRS